MIRTSVSLLALTISLLLPAAAMAQDSDASGSAPPAEAAPPETTDSSAIVVTGRETRTSVVLPGSEMQKILPGVSPLKAIQTLPGVLYITADPWGYNEQNAQIFIPVRRD